MVVCTFVPDDIKAKLVRLASRKYTKSSLGRQFLEPPERYSKDKTRCSKRARATISRVRESPYRCFRLPVLFSNKARKGSGSILASFSKALSYCRVGA